MCTCPVVLKTLLTDLVRSKIDKHLVGRKGMARLPPVYSPPIADASRRIQSMPTQRPNFRAEQSKASQDHANSSDGITRPSQLSPLPESPGSPSHPTIDLETGSEVPIVKRHWWSRSDEPRVHSPQTAESYTKSPLSQFKEIMFSSPVNVLLVFVPVGIALHFVKVSPTVVFVANFLAIIPLAAVCPLFVIL
jgi:hypothetical protein